MEREAEHRLDFRGGGGGNWGKVGGWRDSVGC